MLATPRCVALMGPGLIGGSVLRKLLTHAEPPALRVWGRTSRSLEAVESVFGSRVFTTTDPQDAVRGAEGVILCTPVETMADLARRIVPALDDAAWVTDAGSVKGPVVEQLEPILGDRFLGAHPMAGSEKTGFFHSSAHLFHESVCILTPTERTSCATRGAVQAFWQSLGCRILERSACAHDRAIATISHLPHVVAAALVLASDAESRQMAGPGFRDCTRIAMGDALLWQGILRENRPALLDALGRFRRQMEVLTEALSDFPQEGDASSSDALVDILMDAATQRRSLLPPSQQSSL